MTAQQLQHIKSLLFGHLQSSLTDEQRAELDAWVNESPSHRALFERISSEGFESDIREHFQAKNRMRARLGELTPAFAMNADVPVVRPATRIVHRVHFLKTAWFRYAAAVLVMIGIGATVWMIANKEKPTDTVVQVNPVTTNDILPGSNRAVLTLSNGRQVELDSAATETITDGRLAIRNEEGKLVYGSSDMVAMNTMTTPKGGQYQLTLADGTKVWLNAASSITYPTAFVGEERRVQVTGEVYMEVVPNKSKPFYVDINGQSSVEVLGTSFNINSYTDEGEIKTTLVEGSVKINNQAILKPGQQAVSNGDTKADVRIQSANVAQTLAWKNGLFDFNDADLKAIMRQLERWYDIKVQYNGPVSNEKFEGKMYRSANLSAVLKFLQKMDVNYRLEGKTLIIL